MSPALNGSSVLQRFERSNASEIRNGMFDFYLGLPHMHSLDTADPCYAMRTHRNNVLNLEGMVHFKLLV